MIMYTGRGQVSTVTYRPHSDNGAHHPRFVNVLLCVSCCDSGTTAGSRILTTLTKMY